MDSPRLDYEALVSGLPDALVGVDTDQAAAHPRIEPIDVVGAPFRTGNAEGIA